MRVVFMGTPEFGVATLRALARDHDVVAVFTRPDAISGRGRVPVPSPVKSAAHELGLRVFERTSLREPDAAAEIRELHAEIVVVAAYGLILAPDVIEAAPLGAINVHASLLPRWRGAAPIQRAILAGDTAAGVSIMRMEEGLDTGAYCAQATLPLDDLTAPEATAALAELGAETLLHVLPAIAEGSAEWVDQDPALVTYADKVTKADVAISPDLTAATIVGRIRASMPAARSRAVLGGKPLTILNARLAEIPRDQLPVAPGIVSITKSAVLLGSKRGVVEVLRIKPDGKAEMDASAWARGVRDLDGARWEAAT